MDISGRQQALVKQCEGRRTPVASANSQILRTEWGQSGVLVLLVLGGVQGGGGGESGDYQSQQCLVANGWKLRIPDRPGLRQSASRGVDDQVADTQWLVSSSLSARTLTALRSRHYAGTNHAAGASVIQRIPYDRAHIPGVCNENRAHP